MPTGEMPCPGAFPVMPGGSTEGSHPSVRGAGAAAHCWGQGATPSGRVQGVSACAVCRGGEPLLRCPEVENLGPGKVDACVNLYWVLPDAKFAGFAASPPFPGPGNIFAGRREIV